MKRNLYSILLLAVLVGLGLWLFREPAPSDDSVGPTGGQHEAEAVPKRSVELSLERELVPPSPASDVEALVASPGPKTQGPGGSVEARAGYWGVVKEVGGGGVPNVLVELVDPSGTVLDSTISDESGGYSFDETAQIDLRFITQLHSGAGPRIRHPHARSARGSKRVLWIPPSSWIEGVVVDANGQPVKGANVSTDRPVVMMGMMLWEILEGEEPMMMYGAETDEAGRFLIPSALRGSHGLRASHEGIDGSVKCVAGEGVVQIQLGVHLGGSVVIAGELRERNTHEPIAGATVSISRVKIWPSGRSAIGVANTQTDEQGRYEFLGLDPGRYQLSTRPKGFAPQKTAAPEFTDGFHTVDLTLDRARELLVQVVLPDGSPARGIELRVLDQEQQRLEVEGRFQMLFDEVSVGESGKARLRWLPAAPLTILAVRGDLYPAGKIAVDLTEGSPESVTIVMPTDGKAFGRNHYFKLLGPDGKPATIQGTVIAESFLDGQLVSRVEGRSTGDEFFFGHEEQNGFSTPMIAVGAPSGTCTVELTVPGYQREILQLKAGEVSPTSVRLRE